MSKQSELATNNQKFIPVIDLQAFRSGDRSQRQAVVDRVYQACHEIGFLYIKNPGISTNLIQQLFLHSQQFFNLSSEAKARIAWLDETHNSGYVGIERERLDPSLPGDLKEALNLNLNSLTQNLEFSAEFCNCVLDFWKACVQVTDTVLQSFALALQLPEDFFIANHHEQAHTLRLLHYPPLQQPPKRGQVRAGEHSDYGSITLLFQDDIGGLEIQTKDGVWIAASAIPETIIINTGDLMQRWTNHVFCSTKHRVAIPLDERVRRSRYSIAFFCHPNDDTEVTCLPGCCTDRVAIYPSISAKDYLISRLQATY
ncbi:isopenicillin N synthase family dioxygenase [Scytonema millei]|uniref:Isopenicillin N synthase family oxygenase n=1 Tax=Scytonema millei VB511283 TaxID=1245923 RepID=A0A9X5I3J7_9CYAN|nr:2-oxoglutarate and iron-dependent oxygenase domain-containing protein [Scytonema millei]NHC33644.1 isopenicillin N synthase family oxygenase [Scytonema millei VB511283]